MKVILTDVNNAAYEVTGEPAKNIYDMFHIQKDIPTDWILFIEQVALQVKHIVSVEFLEGE